MSTTNKNDIDVVIDLREQDTAPLAKENKASAYIALAAFTIAFVVVEALIAGAFVAGVVAETALCLLALAVALRSRTNVHSIAIVFSALASARLFTILLPIAGVSTPTRAAVIGIVTLLICRRAGRALGPAADVVEQYKPNSTEARFWRFAPFVAAIALAYAFAFALRPPVLTIVQFGLTHTLAILVAVVGLALAAAGEEILYRGLLNRTVAPLLTTATPAVTTLIWASTYFGIEHAWGVAIVFAAGLLLGVARYRGVSMMTLIIAHTIINVGALMVLPSVI